MSHMDRTITVRTSSTGTKNSGRNLRHNNRLGKNEKHIDYDLVDNNIVYYREEGKLIKQNSTRELRDYVGSNDYEKEAVTELYTDKIDKYNTTQDRTNLKLSKEGFYDNLKGKKTVNLDREIIITVGNKNDFIGMSSKDIESELEMRKKVISKAVDGFEERYPSLKLTQAHIHLDERNPMSKHENLRYINPHAHLDYIPIVEQGKTKNDKYKKPTPSQDKAMMEMFPSDTPRQAYEAFLEDYRGWMDELILEEDPTYNRMIIGADTHLTVDEYKAKEDVLKEVDSLLDSAKQTKKNADLSIAEQGKNFEKVLEVQVTKFKNEVASKNDELQEKESVILVREKSVEEQEKINIEKEKHIDVKTQELNEQVGKLTKANKQVQKDYASVQELFQKTAQERAEVEERKSLVSIREQKFNEKVTDFTDKLQKQMEKMYDNVMEKYVQIVKGIRSGELCSKESLQVMEDNHPDKLRADMEEFISPVLTDDDIKGMESKDDGMSL